MNNILNTFSKISENEGITITKLEQKIGASKGVLSRAIANKTDIQSKWLLKLVENYPQYNPQWLLSGEGSMYKENPGQVKEPRSGYTPVQKNMIPLLTTTARESASPFSLTAQDIKTHYKIPHFEHKKVDFMTEVKDNTMHPTYNSGDIVACLTLPEDSFIQWNKAHLIATKSQGILIKRIQQSQKANHFQLISDNEKYPPIEVLKSEITALALVVGMLRLV